LTVKGGGLFHQFLPVFLYLKLFAYFYLTHTNIRSGQYELCDWIRTCIAKGMNCKVFNFAEKEFNINTYEDLLLAKEMLEFN